ncbi:MAG: hypothetical protein HQL87_07545, partial [Magnetococcales bacterium]|nr:hypothetical protein [Magnetococcales bacterium]
PPVSSIVPLRPGRMSPQHYLACERNRLDPTPLVDDPSFATPLIASAKKSLDFYKAPRYLALTQSNRMGAPAKKPQDFYETLFYLTLVPSNRMVVSAKKSRELYEAPSYLALVPSNREYKVPPHLALSAMRLQPGVAGFGLSAGLTRNLSSITTPVPVTQASQLWMPAFAGITNMTNGWRFCATATPVIPAQTGAHLRHIHPRYARAEGQPGDPSEDSIPKLLLTNSIMPSLATPAHENLKLQTSLERYPK